MASSKLLDYTGLGLIRGGKNYFGGRKELANANSLIAKGEKNLADAKSGKGGLSYKNKARAAELNADLVKARKGEVADAKKLVQPAQARISEGKGQMTRGAVLPVAGASAAGAAYALSGDSAPAPEKSTMDKTIDTGKELGGKALDTAKEYGGKAVDWVKENPGYAMAGAGGTLGLIALYKALRKKNEGSMKTAASATSSTVAGGSATAPNVVEARPGEWTLAGPDGKPTGPVIYSTPDARNSLSHSTTSAVQPAGSSLEGADDKTITPTIPPEMASHSGLVYGKDERRGDARQQGIREAAVARRNAQWPDKPAGGAAPGAAPGMMSQVGGHLADNWKAYAGGGAAALLGGVLLYNLLGNKKKG